MFSESEIYSLAVDINGISMLLTLPILCLKYRERVHTGTVVKLTDDTIPFNSNAYNNSISAFLCLRKKEET